MQPPLCGVGVCRRVLSRSLRLCGLAGSCGAKGMAFIWIVQGFLQKMWKWRCVYTRFEKKFAVMDSYGQLWTVMDTLPFCDFVSLQCEKWET